mgnify:CR=1 FL=1
MTTVEQIIDQDREEFRIRWKKKHGRMLIQPIDVKVYVTRLKHLN